MNLFAYFVIIGLLTAIVGGVGYYSVQELEKVAAQVEQEAREVIDLEEVRIGFVFQYAELDDYIETVNPRAVELYQEKELELEENFQKVKEVAKENGGNAYEVLERLSGVVDNFNRTGLELIALIDEGKKDEAIFKELYELAPLLVDLQISLGDLIVEEEAEFIRKREEAVEAAKLAKTTVIVTAIASIVFVLGLGYFITRRITRPLAHLTETVDEVSRGNFNVHIEKTKSIKEIDVLTDSLDRVMTSMKRAIKRMNKKE